MYVFLVSFIYSLFQDAVFIFSRNNSLNPAVSSFLSRAPGRALCGQPCLRSNEDLQNEEDMFSDLKELSGK